MTSNGPTPTGPIPTPPDAPPYSESGNPQFGNIRDAAQDVRALIAQASAVLRKLTPQAEDLLERMNSAVIAARQQGIDFKLIEILPHPTIRAKIAEDLPRSAPVESDDLAENALATAIGLVGLEEPKIDRLNRKQRKELGLTFRDVRLEARAMRKDGTWDALDNEGRAEAVKLRLQASRVAAYDEYAADIDWDQVMVWISFIVQIISMFMTIFMFI